MKKILIVASFLLLFIAVSTASHGQKVKSATDTSRFWNIYRNGLLFNDLDVAKNALFDLLSAEPENKAVYDSLAHLYFRIGAYDQAIIAANKAESTGAIKEITAYSYRNLGEIKTALPLFEDLYKTNNSIENGYQVATMQFSLKRYGECLETITKLKANPACKTEKVVISTEKGDNMRVTYLAATENLSGVLYNEIGKPELAKAAYERALTEDPNFILAKKNLEELSLKPAAK